MEARNPKENTTKNQAKYKLILLDKCKLNAIKTSEISIVKERNLYKPFFHECCPEMKPIIKEKTTMKTNINIFEN